MANLNDVARVAGVSPITVSRVMNGSTAVRPETKERVLEAVEKLGYQPNLLARALTADRINSIGVLMTRIENPMYSLMISGISSEVAQHDYDILLSGSNDYESSVKSVLTLINKRVSGLLVLPIEYKTENANGNGEVGAHDLQKMQAFSQRLGQIVRDHAPPRFSVVCIGNQIVHGVDGRVVGNYRGGAGMAVDYLAQNGHREIGFLAHRTTNEGIWGERYQGFMEGMRRHGLQPKPQHIAYCGESLSSATAGMQEILRCDERPTAIYCANDTIAAGAMNAIKSAALRVPEDISVIGHDGSSFGEMLMPALTTVAIYPLEIGRQAAALLLDILSGGTGAQVIGSPQIIERDSVMRLS